MTSFDFKSENIKDYIQLLDTKVQVLVDHKKDLWIDCTIIGINLVDNTIGWRDNNFFRWQYPVVRGQAQFRPL